MPHLRLVPAVADDRPRVSLRLLMAASGRCACDDCLLAYRAGNTKAGIVGLPSVRPAGLSAVR
ncbi:MAG: hypothetical protein QOF18_2771 [Frankiaceae bacterium]|jgi:hypothetical protein|nr:hypothetical protein [Frankiaceae bacterium]